MGMYTELHFNAELKDDVPEDVMDTLRFMVGLESEPPLNTPDHPLFSTYRWDFMLECDSYYFPASTRSELVYAEPNDDYYLCIRCNLKNYDKEIQKFIDWITPYVDSAEGECLGYYRYEECDQPTIIYYKGGEE